LEGIVFYFRHGTGMQRQGRKSDEEHRSWEAMALEWLLSGLQKVKEKKNYM
jgi:hypothetical protein